jgi:cytochrome P450
MTSPDGPALVPASTPGPHDWEIVRYQQARWALSARCLSKDPRLAWEALGYSRAGLRSDSGERNYVRNLANSDPPDHTRLRAFLAKAFTPARVKRIQPQIVSAAEALTDHLPATNNIDLIQSFIFPLQVKVTCDLLGIPLDHRHSYRLLAAAMRAPTDNQQAYSKMSALVAGVLATKRGQICHTDSPDSQPDLLSALVSVRDDSGGLTASETQAMAMLLISAGQEPTIDLIANGMLALLRNPTQLHLFRKHPELRPQTVEELLRCEAPVSSALRIAAEDIEIDGTIVRRGNMIAVILDRAHRDPWQFPRPDALDITRKRPNHLAFGHGIHYCIGAPLARLQTVVALTSLVTRFPHIALAQSPDQLCWRQAYGIRGLAELPVILGRSGIQPSPIAGQHLARLATQEGENRHG